MPSYRVVLVYEKKGGLRAPSPFKLSLPAGWSAKGHDTYEGSEDLMYMIEAAYGELERAAASGRIGAKYSVSLFEDNDVPTVAPAAAIGPTGSTKKSRWMGLF